jgi:hypothetical protein
MKETKQEGPLKAEVKTKGLSKFIEGELEAAQHLENMLSGASIADDEDYKATCGLLFEVAEQKKRAEEKKDEVVGPAKLIIATINEWFSPLEKRLKEREAALKELVRKYAIDREHQRIAQLRSGAKLAKVDPSKAQELIRTADDVLAPKVKGIAFQGKLKFKVFDESKIPDAYFTRVLNEDAVQAAVEAGEEVPGIAVVDERIVKVTPSQRAKEQA